MKMTEDIRIPECPSCGKREGHIPAVVVDGVPVARCVACNILWYYEEIKTDSSDITVFRPKIVEEQEKI